MARGGAAHAADAYDNHIVHRLTALGESLRATTASDGVHVC